jgi:hypothetical protein
MRFIFVFFLLSCTHWFTETETRLQMENLTKQEIHSLSLVSKEGKVHVLVPDTLEPGEFSRVYENGWVGEFKFAVFADSRIDLGSHALKGGSILAKIKESEENGEIFLVFK